MRVLDNWRKRGVCDPKFVLHPKYRISVLTSLGISTVGITFPLLAMGKTAFLMSNPSLKGGNGS